jgi:hypothetical protein
MLPHYSVFRKAIRALRSSAESFKPNGCPLIGPGPRWKPLRDRRREAKAPCRIRCRGASPSPVSDRFPPRRSEHHRPEGVGGDLEPLRGRELVVGVERRHVATRAALLLEDLLALAGTIVEPIRVRGRLQRVEVKGKSVELLVAVACPLFSAEPGPVRARLKNRRKKPACPGPGSRSRNA